MKSMLEKEGGFRYAAKTSSRGVEIQRAKLRCRAVIDRLLLTLSPNPSDSYSCCNRTILRLAQSELSFLSRFPDLNPVPNSFSSNIGHLEAVLYILQQPFIKGVSRVCKPVSLSPWGLLKYGKNSAATIVTITKSVHVDIACTLNGNPVWWIVSDRNPKFVSWNGSCQNKSLRTRIEQVLDAAAYSFPSTKPCSIIFFFSHGLDESIRKKLEHEFGASELGIEFPVSDFGFSEELEGEWIYIHHRSFGVACVLEIKVELSKNVVPNIECGFKDPFPSAVAKREDLQEECISLNLGGSLCSLMSKMKKHPLDLKHVEFTREKGYSGEVMVNFDTTALIALISGISNGATDKILSKSERELRLRFKSNYEFVIAQVITEIQNPIHVELDAVLSEKRGMICKLVCSEFKKIVSMCGGPNEKSRAGHILKCLMVVADSPSSHMMSLPNTRKLALKNKVCFGTGDHWRAPTLTANMAFVRAIAQTGMSLFTIQHMPLALTGHDGRRGSLDGDIC